MVNITHPATGKWKNGSLRTNPKGVLPSFRTSHRWFFSSFVVRDDGLLLLHALRLPLYDVSKLISPSDPGSLSPLLILSMVPSPPPSNPLHVHGGWYWSLRVDILDFCFDVWSLVSAALRTFYRWWLSCPRAWSAPDAFVAWQVYQACCFAQRASGHSHLTPWLASSLELSRSMLLTMQFPSSIIDFANAFVAMVSSNCNRMSIFSLAENEYYSASQPAHAGLFCKACSPWPRWCSYCCL